MKDASTDPQKRNLDHLRPFHPRLHTRSRHYTFFVTFFLLLVLFSTVVGSVTIAVPHALAAQRPLPQPVKVTYKQFLNPKVSHLQPFTFPQPKAAPWASELKNNTAKVLPSVEPAKMQPIHQMVSAAFLAASTSTATHSLTGGTVTSANPLLLRGSDGRVTVTIPAGALDSTHVTTTSHVSVAAIVQQQGLTVTLTQRQGNSVGGMNLLGQYQFQLTDAQAHTLMGVQLRQPITITYHYQPQEIRDLGMDPGNLVLTWPEQIQQAIAAKQATTNLVVPMHNDPVAHTLTAQTSVLGTLADVGAGTPTDQSPPKPNMASVGDNSGQLSYAYPIQVAPGPNGTTPTVELAYSSANSNERHYTTSPADSPGEGWGTSMGSITMSTYPAGSSTSGTWYSLSGVDNVSDRLIPTAAGSTSYYTEHISHLKLTRVTQSNGQPCFKVWDTSGDYSEYGCTSDSLQYSTDSTGTRTNYRWDLDRVVPVGDAISGDTRFMAVSYLQDQVVTNKHTTIRDAVIKQITYGTATSGSGLSGTVDFLYKGVTANSSAGIQWVTAYGTNGGGCKPPAGLSTTLRCDDPLDYGTMLKPPVMSTFSLQTIKTYVGSDTSAPLQPDYSYSFTYNDTPFHACVDALTGTEHYCIGEHVLSSITPTVYQNSTAHTLPDITFSYTGLHNNYVDTTQKVNGKAYTDNNYLYYLGEYHDHSNGTGEKIVYQTAYNNTHGTPDQSNGENRNDANYCWVYTGCTGAFANPNDKAWTEQVVHTITTIGTDSSSSSLQPATTTYHYGLASVSGSCPADSLGETYCVGYTWGPSGDTDWQDNYHVDFHGFTWVYITSPANNLTALNYASTEGVGTSEQFSGNYTSGQLYQTYSYSGPNSVASNLLSVTRNTYAGNGTTFACITTIDTHTYTPCEVMLTQTRTTTYEQNTTLTPPWIENDYTYDDYTASKGLGNYSQLPATGAYHNRQQEVTTSSNAPTVTKKWTYDTTDTTVNGTIYYDVSKVAHSDIVDASSHMWQCADTLYDEGVAAGVPKPAAGWATTDTTYSNCANQSGTAIKTYTGYDTWGDTVASVDGVAAAAPTLYSSAGCTLSTAPAFFPTGSWSATRYTSCDKYDSISALSTDSWDMLGHHTTMAYDGTQGQLPTTVTDVDNSATTTTSYSYDGSGNPTVSVKKPGETGSYTSRGTTVSTCTDSSTFPCLEVDGNTSFYSSAVTRTFYDSLGRKVETLTPGPDASHTIVTFTVYNDAAHSIFESLPFRVASRTTWLDPNGATDDTGIAPGGTVTVMDALGSTVSTTDATASVSSTVYGLGSVSGDSNTYEMVKNIDANGHVQMNYIDSLGRTRYVVTESGKNGGTLTPIKQVTTQYNALDKPTSVIVTDLAPQSGQTITSVTTTTQYDDLGRVTSVSDPDRGTHTYTYDADDKQLTDVSGTRTIGISYDLLGRARCIQDAAPTTDGSGNCSSGSHPLVQNTYDTSTLGTAGSTDFPVGQLTQSIATTYYTPTDYTNKSTVTEQFQHDQRGQSVATTLQVSVPSSWGVTTGLPTYKQTQTYNNADQPMMTQTTAGASAGYTFSQAYDSTTGQLTGLSNNGTGVANLATMSFNAQGLASDVNFQTTTGTQLANDHFVFDGDLRPASTTATWQSGSGATGTIFSSSRAYDAVGNVASVSNTQATLSGQSSSGGSEVQNFCYDEQNRLIWAGNGGTQPGAGNGTCGNITLANSLSGAGYSNSTAYTNLGQIWQGPLNGSGTAQQYLYCDSTHPHQLKGLYPIGTTCASPTGATYTASYDAWGNLTSRTYAGTTATLTYDVLDHLVAWDAGSTNQEWYAYDASGNRVLRRSTTGSGTSITTYAFGLEEHLYDATGMNTGNTYYYSLGGRIIGALTGITTLTPQFFLTDALGSVLATFSATAGSAEVLGNQVYGPYGNQRYTQGSMGTAKGYTGQYADATGLDYYNARYYDPIVGRFVSADTVQGNEQGMDPYAYVMGNPETMNDPTGHWGWGETLAAAGAIIAVAAIVTVVAIACPVLVVGLAAAAGAEVTLDMTAITAAAVGAGADAAVGAFGSEAILGINSAVTGQEVSGRDIWDAAYMGGMLTGGFGWAGEALGLEGWAGLAVDKGANAVGTALGAGFTWERLHDHQSSTSQQKSVSKPSVRRTSSKMAKKATAPKKTRELTKSELNRVPSSKLMKQNPIYYSYSYYQYTPDTYYSYSYSVYSYSIDSLTYHTSIFSASNGYYERSTGGMHMS